MSASEKINVSIAGHEIRLEIHPEEKKTVEHLAKGLSSRIQELTVKAPSAAQSKIAVMVAFELACQLAEAEALLKKAAFLEDELQQSKEAVSRLEGLLEKVDAVLV
ncbi:MAG: cell division protein ZapA [Sumerlaeia bacterium]